MARSKDARASAEFGKNLRALNRHAGSPTMKELERLLWGRGLSVGDETLRLYHEGERDPAHVSVAVAVAIADEYGVEVGALHPSFTARAESEGKVLARFASGPPEKASHPSTWQTANVAA